MDLCARAQRYSIPELIHRIAYLVLTWPSMHGEYNFFIKTLVYYNVAHSDLHYFPGSVLSNLGITNHLISLSMLQRNYFYPYSRNVEIKAEEIR